MPDEQTDDMPPMRIYVDADAVPRGDIAKARGKVFHQGVLVPSIR